MNGSVLVVRVGAMGDVLHALPAVAAFRQLRPEANIAWVVDTRWAPLLAGPDGRGPVVSRVHLADTRLWSRQPASLVTLRSIRDLRRQLRQLRPDHVVDMQGTLRSALIARLAGSSRVVGYADPREATASWFHGQAHPRRGIHVVDQGASLLGDALGLALTPVSAPLPVDPDAERWAAELFDGLSPGSRTVLLAPTAGWAAKQWPAERFRTLAQDLAASGWRVLVNASGPDDPTAERVRSGSSSITVVQSGIGRLVSLLRRVTVMVGGDSGPVHLAAALGRPVVGLYGPTDPARNGPWGPGPKIILRSPASVTSYKHTAQPDPGLGSLSVAEVLAAVESVSSQG